MKQHLLLVAILTLAAFLRVWGIAWGVPSATHYFSYHPDESVVLGVATAMDSLHGQLLPHFYNYGSLQIYLVNFADTLAFVFGGVNLVAALQNPADYGDWSKLLLVGRYLTVAMGIGTVWATYALGTRLFGRRAGLCAALLLAVTPLHAQHSHWLTVDVPATFWAVLSLVWAARLAMGDDPKPTRAAILVGVFAGLAAATKYNLAVVVLAGLAVAALTPRPPLPILGEGETKVKPSASDSPSPKIGRGGPGVRAALLSAVLAFLLACPGALLEHAKFVEALRFEAVHVQNADDATFRGTGNGFLYHVVTNLSAGLGGPLLFFALVSVIYALFRRQRGDGILASFALPYYVLIGLAAVRYARYTMPLLPILAIWAGRLAADVLRLLDGRRFLLGTARFAFSGLFLVTLTFAVFLVWQMTGVDSRDAALATLQARASPSSKIGFAAMPWFQVPPVNPYFPAPMRGSWQRVVTPEERARFVYDGKDFDVTLLEREKPEFVVVSEFDYDDARRRGDPSEAEFFRVLNEKYNSWLLGARSLRSQPHV